MKTAKSLSTDGLLREYRFADFLCSAHGRFAYVCLGQVGPDNTSIVSVGDWAGGRPDESSSLAPFIAHGKMGELLWHGKSEGLSLTPVPDIGQVGFGWMGGARYDSNIVAVSQWRQEHDRLLALIVLYSFQSDIYLHHVGFRHSTFEDALAVAEARGEYLRLPAEDHQRWYHRVVGEQTPHRAFYIEDQFFPDGPQTPAFHWDLVTRDPEGFLTFVAEAYNMEPKLWEAGENDPVGLVWITAEKDGSTMGVMARSRWWEIEV